MLVLVGASKDFQNVDTGRGSGDDRITVKREGEMDVRSDSQYARFAFYRLHGVVQGHVAMIIFFDE